MQAYYDNFALGLKEVSKSFNQIHDLKPLLEKISSSKLVMLGESTHGTKEFYYWRSLITQRLIEDYGFRFVGIEGDWTACSDVEDRLMKENNSYALLSAFNRWPTWMWGNQEVGDFLSWLKDYNQQVQGIVGFHGLDLYSFFDSVEQVLKHLKQHEPDLARTAEEYYSCLSAYQKDEMSYARSLFKASQGCREEIISALKMILKNHQAQVRRNPISMQIIQNARVVANAESFYRAMMFGQESSWNIRDQHMMETIETLFEHYGAQAKGIIWAHNSHIGDYRATDMVQRNEVNVGGLAREILGKEHVSLVGFGTWRGKVMASHAWDGVAESMNLVEAKPESIEDYYHKLCLDLGTEQVYSWFDSKASLAEVKEQRAVGVVYQSRGEERRNYVPTVLNQRYDGFIFINQTSALSPLGLGYMNTKLPESYPFGQRL